MADVVGRKHWVLYYDGECGFCTRSVQALAFADFFRVVAVDRFSETTQPSRRANVGGLGRRGLPGGEEGFIRA